MRRIVRRRATPLRPDARPHAHGRSPWSGSVTVAASSDGAVLSDPPARTEDLEPDTARWLVSPAGRAARRRAQLGLAEGTEQLRVVTRLRDEGLTAPQTAAATSAALAALRAPERPGVPDGLVFTLPALEQASDPTVAAWRARRFEERTVCDVTCGAGSDLLALGAVARTTVGSDRDEARVVLAAWNVETAGVDAHVVVGDALRPPVRADAAFADPSRRLRGRRARKLRDYQPPVPDLLEVLRGRDAGIAASPALDWSDPGLPSDAEVEFVQRGRDLVEATLWTAGLRREAVRATATLLDHQGTAVQLTRPPGPVDELPVGPIGEVLLEVAPAAVRARLHDRLGQQVGAHRIARSRALLTTDAPPPASPWIRAWHVEAALPARPKAVRTWLRGADDQPLEIGTSGFDTDLEDWWRGLGEPPRGPNGRRLLLARLDRRSHALMLTPLDRTTGPHT